MAAAKGEEVAEARGEEVAEARGEVAAKEQAAAVAQRERQGVEAGAAAEGAQAVTPGPVGAIAVRHRPRQIPTLFIATACGKAFAVGAT